MEKNDMIFSCARDNYNDAESLISVLYDRCMKNPDDEEMRLILAQTVQMAKGIARTQEAILELYPEDVKQANLPSVEAKINSLDEDISTIMSGKAK